MVGSIVICYQIWYLVYFECHRTLFHECLLRRDMYRCYIVKTFDTFMKNDGKLR